MRRLLLASMFSLFTTLSLAQNRLVPPASPFMAERCADRNKLLVKGLVFMRSPTVPVNYEKSLDDSLRTLNPDLKLYPKDVAVRVREDFINQKAAITAKQRVSEPAEAYDAVRRQIKVFCNQVVDARDISDFLKVGAYFRSRAEFRTQETADIIEQVKVLEINSVVNYHELSQVLGDAPDRSILGDEGTYGFFSRTKKPYRSLNIGKGQREYTVKYVTYRDLLGNLRPLVVTIKYEIKLVQTFTPYMAAAKILFGTPYVITLTAALPKSTKPDDRPLPRASMVVHEIRHLLDYYVRDNPKDAKENLAYDNEMEAMKKRRISLFESFIAGNVYKIREEANKKLAARDGRKLDEDLFRDVFRESLKHQAKVAEQSIQPVELRAYAEELAFLTWAGLNSEEISEAMPIYPKDEFGYYQPMDGRPYRIPVFTPLAKAFETIEKMAAQKLTEP